MNFLTLFAKILKYVSSFFEDDNVNDNIHEQETDDIKILSVIFNRELDITALVKNKAGPFPFFNGSLERIEVEDIIPEYLVHQFDRIEIMVLVHDHLKIHEYEFLDDILDFHHGIEWAKYSHPQERDITLANLSYLDLAN
jgi:hypothetical protein